MLDVKPRRVPSLGQDSKVQVDSIVQLPKKCLIHRPMGIINERDFTPDALYLTRWKYWGRMSLSDVRDSKDWCLLCRHRYLCEVHTHKMLGELMKKGYHVVHLSGDELNCFADLLKERQCPTDVLLCVLDDVLYRDET